MTSNTYRYHRRALYDFSFGLTLLIVTPVSLFVAIYGSKFMHPIVPPECCGFNRMLVDVLRLKIYKKTRISAGFETFLDFLEFQDGAEAGLEKYKIYL